MRSSIHALVLGAVLSLAASATAAEGRRPNILLMLADDMGFSDIGPYGGEINTPNLDRLAAGGLRFTQFYNAARCCPTRAALLTGLYPHQAGVGDMVGNRGTPAYQGFLNERCATIAEVLRARGYTTIISVKGSDRNKLVSEYHYSRPDPVQYQGGAAALCRGTETTFVISKVKRYVLCPDSTPPFCG